MLLNYSPSKIWTVFIYYTVYCISDGLAAIIQISEGGVANQYIGCYSDKGNGSNWTVGFAQSSDLSINGCLERCRHLNRTYAILQRGKDCLCGDSFNSSISNDLCNADLCSGNSSEYCGGSKMGLQYSIFYAVCPIGRYLADCSGVCHCNDQISCNLLTGVCPNGCEGNWTNSNCNEESTFIGRYIGCYKDNFTQALPVLHRFFANSNPIRLCSRFCALSASTYVGLQASEYCLCGENYSRHGKAEESECNMTCKGNRSQICGYHWRNSVYSVCSAGRFGTECLYSCNCRDKEVCNVRSGSCKSGCKPGWTGDSCSVRNCSSDNGDCSANETCVTVNLGYASVSRCLCFTGYGRDALWDNCRDLDECSLSTSVCDKETETCHNSFGGFNCTCISGYQRMNPGDKCHAANQAAKQNSNTGIVVGAVLFIIALVITAIAAVFFCRRRLKRTAPGRHNEHDHAFSYNNRDNAKENVSNEQGPCEENSPEEECSYYSFNSKTTRIKIECLADIVKRLHENPGDLQKEFKSVAEHNGAPSNVGKRKELKEKNRFKNILPYDHNRVILSKKEGQNFSDYINASHITGYQKSDMLIATQGPTADSVDDFWRMIFEKHVTIIVMMTNIKENGKKKCHKYWPDAGELLTFEDITVSFVSDQKWDSFERRLLLAKRKSVTLEVTQWHYTSWPDHGVPQDTRCFLAFRRKVRNSMSTDSSTVIHCSAGVGRTGCYIAIDNLLEEAKTGYVDVLGCLRTLRQQRTQMIQTVEQYKVVYTALLEHLRMGDTAMGRDSLERRIGELRSKDQFSAKTKLAIQFEMLDHEKQTRVNAKNKTNDMGNPATFEVQVSRTSNSYAIKSVALSERPDEFWTWQIDHRSKLIILINEGQNELLFLPTTTKPVELSNFTLVIDSMTEEEHVTVCDIKILQESLYANEADASESRKMTLLNVHARSSPGRDVVNHESIFEVYSIMKRYSPVLKNDTINVISLNGEQLGAFCVAAFNAFDMITEENEVDVYQIVHDLRMSNSSFVSTLNAYDELHSLVKSFVQRYYSTELYQEAL